MFVRNDLNELVACDKQPAVSICMPTHSTGRKIRQDAIQLRNLLNAAAKRLGAEHRPPEITALLEPARRLVDDEEFWRYQARGLGVFLAPGFHRVHKLPIEVAEEGTQLYFHRNSLVNRDFDRLKVGDRVHFVETVGDTGPIASKVWPVEGEPG